MTDSQKSYAEWMARKEDITLRVSPSALERKKIEEEYFFATGTDNPYEHKEVYDEIQSRYGVTLTLSDTSWQAAQEFAEPIRIAHPDQCVSLYTKGGGSWIGYTTWNDQMKMFWGYEVFTPIGQRLKDSRAFEAEVLEGLQPAWE